MGVWVCRVCGCVGVSSMGVSLLTIFVIYCNLQQRRFETLKI